MSRKKDPKRENAVAFADAINRINGIPISDDAQQLSAKWVHGEITGDEMVAALIKKHSCTQTVSND